MLRPQIEAVIALPLQRIGNRRQRGNMADLDHRLRFDAQLGMLAQHVEMIDGIAEMIRIRIKLCAGGGGILVPRDDSAAMARAIERIAAMPEGAWREMSDKAYATASCYTWDEATDLFEAALHRAIERTQRGDFQQGQTPVPPAATPAPAEPLITPPRPAPAQTRP